jgi:hypothetical protein
VAASSRPELYNGATALPAMLIPYVALLWLPFYNDTRPSFAGFPFFYWYQLLWVPLTSLTLYVIYKWVR